MDSTAPLATEKIFYRNGSMVGVRYHANAVEPARAQLRTLLPRGAMLLLVGHGQSRYDIYANRCVDGVPEVLYITKRVGAALEFTVWDGAKRNGIDLDAYGPYGFAKHLARVLHDDPEALTWQELGD